jgi:hypothetical protein
VTIRELYWLRVSAKALSVIIVEDALNNLQHLKYSRKDAKDSASYKH